MPRFPSFALICLLAASAPGAAAPEASPLVVGQTFVLHSEVLDEDRRINVWYPTGFDPQGTRELPLMLMPDGGLHEDFLHIAGLLQVLSTNGSIRPFLLAGIENTERRRDLTPPTEVAEDRKIAPRVGGSARFRQFIREELLPELEGRYPLTAERGIVGESLAGLFVVETFLVEPSLFDHWFAIDPSLWWNAGQLVEQAGELLQQGNPRAEQLFLANSREADITLGTARLVERLRTDAPWLRVEHAPMPDEAHSTIFHPAALQGFRTLLKADPP